jgi:hypothetical protein
MLLSRRHSPIRRHPVIRFMQSPRRGESILGLTTGEGSHDTTRAWSGRSGGSIPITMSRANRSLPLPVPAALSGSQKDSRSDSSTSSSEQDAKSGQSRSSGANEVGWSRSRSIQDRPGVRACFQNSLGRLDEGPDWLIQRPSTTAAAEISFPRLASYIDSSALFIRSAIEQGASGLKAAIPMLRDNSYGLPAVRL